MTIEATQIPDGWRIAQLGEVAEVAFSSVDKKTVEGEVAVELCNYTDVFYNPRIVPGMPLGSATGTSRSMFNVSQDSIRRVRVVLPPIDEQEAIAAALNSVDIRIARASEERARLQSLQASAADALLTGRVRAPSGTPER